MFVINVHVLFLHFQSVLEIHCETFNDKNNLSLHHDVDVDRVYERRPKASMPTSCEHFTIY